MACKLCVDSRRADIEASLLSGLSIRAVADKYDIGRGLVFTHKSKCMINVVARIEPVSAGDPPQEPSLPVASRLDAYERMVKLLAESEAQLQEAKKKGGVYLVATAMEQVRKNLEVMLKIYEAQHRIKSLYGKKDNFDATVVYQWLSTHYPDVLSELGSYISGSQ